jgi:SOS response associated peptidase (SRAP)
MCGRATYKLTWEEIVALYQLTLFQPAVNTRARYNVCPTTTVDTIRDQDGKRTLERMRWGLIPSWWSKPLKEMKLATFNAQALFGWTDVKMPMLYTKAADRQHLSIEAMDKIGMRDTEANETATSIPAPKGEVRAKIRKGK